MRVAIIAHPLHVAGGLSVGKNIVMSLQRVAPENKYLFLLPAHVGYEDLEMDESCSQVVYHDNKGGPIRRALFENFTAKRIIGEFHPDIILCLAGQGASMASYPQAVLCHDSHLFYPSKHFATETLKRKLVKHYKKWRLGKNLRYTQLVFCQTAVTEKRLKEKFHYTGKTAICPNAVSVQVMDGAAAETCPEALVPYADKFKLLCLTRYYPHKNLERVVEMFDRYRDDLKDVVVVLTISEDQHAKAGKLLQKIDHLGLAGSIVNIGPVPQKDLGGYFGQCQGLLLPTLLESLSSSYLEAMHFGVPILTSDLDFAHEVCGDCAIYFNPWKPEEIKDAILKLKNSPDLAEDLVSKGKTQLQSEYKSWDEITKEIVNNLSYIVQQQSVSS